MSLQTVDLSHITVWTVVLVYAAGFLTSLTPCVYPLIPITIGFVGARSTSSRSQSFILSLSYVLGLACVYTGLGMFAALTGKLFGTISSHPLTFFLVANLYIFLALAMLDVFHFQLSHRAHHHIKESALQREEKDIAAGFLIGASSAFVAGPCTAPVLGALLVGIGKGHNVFVGGLLMFIFSLGLGTLLLLLGTFAGLAAHLPKSGTWLKVVKVVFALVLLGAGEYFLVQAGKALF